MTSGLFFKIDHFQNAAAHSFLNKFRPIKAQWVENFTTYIMNVVIKPDDAYGARNA